MGTNMMIFLVIVGVLLFIGLPIIAIIEARRMDKGKGSLLSKCSARKDKEEVRE
jgi:competence protein ComGC